MISPTIGRVVLVHGMRLGQTQAMPALVAFVHSDRLINVGGFDNNGAPFAQASLRLLQDDDAPPTAGPYAEWMPYQKAQAAKHEQPAPPPADNAHVAPGCEQFPGLTGAVLTEGDAAADLAGTPRPDIPGTSA